MQLIYCILFALLIASFCAIMIFVFEWIESREVVCSKCKDKSKAAPVMLNGKPLCIDCATPKRRT